MTAKPRHQFTLLRREHAFGIDLLASCLCGNYERIYPVLRDEREVDIKAKAVRAFHKDHWNQ